jgi:hypothetical protein
VLREAYADYWRPIKRALIVLLEGLPVGQQEAVLPDQAMLATAATVSERVARWARSCPALHNHGQTLARQRVDLLTITHPLASTVLPEFGMRSKPKIATPPSFRLGGAIWLRGEDLNLRPSGYEPERRRCGCKESRPSIFFRQHDGEHALGHGGIGGVGRVTRKVGVKIDSMKRTGHESWPAEWSPR